MEISTKAAVTEIPSTRVKVMDPREKVRVHTKARAMAKTTTKAMARAMAKMKAKAMAKAKANLAKMVGNLFLESNHV